MHQPDTHLLMYLSTNRQRSKERCAVSRATLGFRTDRATTERNLYEKPEGKYFPILIEQTMRLILLSCLLFGFWFVYYKISQYSLSCSSVSAHVKQRADIPFHLTISLFYPPVICNFMSFSEKVY